MGTRSSKAAEVAGPPDAIRNAHANQLNDTLYELYKPAGTPTLQIVFFHGLQAGDDSKAYLSAWASGDGSCVWPQTWLVDEFPHAQVFSIASNEGVRSSSYGGIDLHVIGENLVSDMLHGGIGQVAYCPVVLVGHSIGGLIIKQVCLRAHDMRHLSTSGGTKVEKFLDNLKGVFYYSTPHHGLNPDTEKLANSANSPPLLRYHRTLNKEFSRLNSLFQKLCDVHRDWQFAALGECRTTKIGSFKEVMVVPEASSRSENYNVVESADHFSVCRPASRTSRSFFKLKSFVDQIARNSRSSQNLRPVQNLKPAVVDCRRPIATERKVEASSSNRRDLKVTSQKDSQEFPESEDVDADAFDWYDDPLTWEKMCDPVMCSDGRTYDRWTILDQRLKRSPYDPSITSFGILCDDITTRSRLFKAFPDQEVKFRQRRKEYREVALQHARAFPNQFEKAVEKLSNVLKWLPLDKECQYELVKLLSRKQYGP